jgi:hypothetical protein
MFGLFQTPSFVDPHLGELLRRRGRWRGTVTLDGVGVRLVLSGSRSAPDRRALEIARSLGSRYASWQGSIGRALYEHFEPYGEAVRAGELGAPGSGLPRIERPADVWPHTKVEFVQVTPLGGRLTVEIGYRVAWDEEHTLGARFRDDKLLELNGSVRTP